MMGYLPLLLSRQDSPLENVKGKLRGKKVNETLGPVRATY